MKRLYLFTLAFLGGCEAASADPQLNVADRLVWSEPPTVIATGLEPNSDFTLVTERRSLWGTATERSELKFRSSSDGEFDTSVTPATGRDVADPYEPIRSMSYLQGEELADLDKHFIRFRVLDAAGTKVTERIVGIGPDREALVEMSLGSDFPGAYIMRPEELEEPRPAIILLGGSEGGDSGSRSLAPLYAAEGYVVLGLPYYSPAWGGQAQFPDLPSAFADIRVDYLEEAVVEIRKRDDVEADKVLLVGVSKGAEFALLAGALIPDESAGGGFCGIVADVPSDVVWEGWGAGTEAGQVSSFSWRGESLPFIPYQDIGRALDSSDSYTMTDAHVNGRLSNPDRVEDARIPVERIDETVLLIGGMQDQVWNSGEMARSIVKTRNAAGLETEAYIYNEGGHGVGGSPLVRTSRANLSARLENFPATIEFLKRQAQRDDCRGQTTTD